MKSGKLSVALIAIMAVALISASACKHSGMAVTSRGQVLRLNIERPVDLPEQGVDNVKVSLTNAGVNNVTDVLLEVQLPPQIAVLNMDAPRGVNVLHNPGSNVYLFTFDKIQPTENTSISFNVRATFGSVQETGNITATAWQRALPGDKLIETAMIRMRR